MDDGRESQLKLSRYLIVGDVVRGPSEDLRIVMSTRSGRCLLIADRTWQELRDGVIPDESSAIGKDLAETQVLVRQEENELTSVVLENKRAIESSTQLLQIIQPSAACQLACGYCGQEHRDVSMEDSVQSGLIKKVESRLADAAKRDAPYTEVRIGWFGAEPLLAMPAIRSLTLRLKASAHRSGCDYSAHMVTNGLGLSVRVARELQEELGVKHVEVTLDGPARSHDLRRITKNSGRGTFSSIIRRLQAIALVPDISLNITIRCNVDGSNADSIPELIDMLADEGLQARYSLYFAPVHAWGNDANRISLDPAEFAEREVGWLAQMLSRGYSVDLIPERQRIVCMSVRTDSRVTDADGNEYNCTEVPYVPTYGTPNSYITGHTNVADDTAHLYFEGFNDLLLDREELPCHSCSHLPVCGGACPKSWADGTPPCPSFRLNAPDRLTMHIASALHIRERDCDRRV